MELTDENDPGRWGHSLGNAAELLTGCLDAVGARSVVEVGAYAGDLTRELLQWAEGSGATVMAIDPEPAEPLDRLEQERPELTVVREPSLEALAHVEIPDAVIIDGDHNYYTVSGELAAIAERVGGADLPLLLFHDVCWPHARRDTFYVPERIPEEYKRDMVEGAHVFPGEPGLTPGGLPYKYAAAREGGPRNGVLTAIEDFVESRRGLRLAVVPVFFGFGLVWHEDAPWSEALAGVVDAWDRHPILTKLEENRVFHLATSQKRATENWLMESKLAQQENLLRELLSSGAFRMADRLSHLRNRGRGVTWQERIRQALDG